MSVNSPVGSEMLIGATPRERIAAPPVTTGACTIRAYDITTTEGGH